MGAFPTFQCLPPRGRVKAKDFPRRRGTWTAGRAQLNVTLPQPLLEFSSSGLEKSGQKGILEVPFPSLSRPVETAEGAEVGRTPSVGASSVYKARGMQSFNKWLWGSGCHS